MSFINIHYALYVFLCLVVLSFFLLKTEVKFFSWVNSFWFFKRSMQSKLSSLLYFIGFGFLLVSLMDLRGPNKNIEGEVSDKKTLILFDSSLSMLTEDVRPNRFQKAIFMARHLMKKAANHKMSIVLFSDNTKRLVPFTGDKQLLDARISGLIEKGVSGGGSDIVKAVKESLRYFKVNGETFGGNIIIYTDGESHIESVNLEVPDNINLAVVGVGTAKGDLVPLGNSPTLRGRYKQQAGKNVTSSLDEKFIEKLGKDVKYYKYWLASTYSLPTEEILSFFEKSNTQRVSKESVMTRPVYAHYLMIPGVIALILSFFFKNFTHMFIKICLVFLILPLTLKAQPAEISPEDLEKQKHLEQAQVFLDKWKTEELSESEKMKLASKLLQADENDKAAKIFEKNLGGLDESNLKDYFNWATTDLKRGKFRSALGKLDELNKTLETSPNVDKDFKEKVRKNLLLALKNSESRKGGKGKKSDKSQKSDKKNDKLSGEKRMKELDKKNVSGVLKQILDEDRNLQKKYLNTATKDKKGKPSNLKKDW